MTAVTVSMLAFSSKYCHAKEQSDAPYPHSIFGGAEKCSVTATS